MPNIPLHPLLQQNKASLPRRIQNTELKMPHIHLKIIQQAPRHLLSRINIQIRIGGLVNAHIGPYQPISARSETVVSRAVHPSAGAACGDS